MLFQRKNAGVSRNMGGLTINRNKGAWWLCEGLLIAVRNFIDFDGFYCLRVDRREMHMDLRALKMN